ncbi:MAG: VOC family protein [Patescibacteria group bacterium]
MLKESPAFSGFSVRDIEEARAFYGDTLGLDAAITPEGLSITFGNGVSVFLYPKPDHVPATFTVLNFPVEDIDAAVDMLTEKGIRFEHYEGEIQTDEKGIARPGAEGMGPAIAWFKDPSGNILSVLEE